MNGKPVLLGFEVGTGIPIEIPIHHLIVTGITQYSGKTTCIEALIHRSGLRAIVFKTKRGETGFEAVGHDIPPFYVERGDWRYIESLIEAIMQQKVRFERSWIIRACKATAGKPHPLHEVRDWVHGILHPPKGEKKRLRGIDESIYTNIEAYLDIIVPQIDETNFSQTLEPREGVNVMNLEKLSEEVQNLVIRSVIEHVWKKLRDVVIVMPEAWKFLPQKRGSPVKWAAEHLVREGAAIGNYLWVDSQDMSGTDKAPLKQVDNWILGLQTEKNEVQHTLDEIRLPAKLKPKPDEIMTLKKGHFIACFRDRVVKVYVQPSWLPENVAIDVAKGVLNPESDEVKRWKPLAAAPIEPEPVEAEVPASILERLTRLEQRLAEAKP